MKLNGPLQIKRSLVPGNVPATLAEGEIAVNIPDRIVWVGDQNGTPVQISNAEMLAYFLPLAGGEMTGTIVGPTAGPTLEWHAGAMNAGIASNGANVSLFIGLDAYLTLQKDLLVSSQPMELPADPLQGNHAATKDYVDGKIAAVAIPTPTPDRLGGVHSGEAAPGNAMYGIDTAGDPIFKEIALPYPQDMKLGGVFASYPQAGKYVSAINSDGTVWLESLPVVTPYVLPTASAAVLGGIKIGTGLSIDANGVVSASGGASGSYLPLAGGTMTGDIIMPTTGAVGMKFGTAASRIEIVGGTSQLYVKYGTANIMWFGTAQVQSYAPILLPADPTNALHAATKQYVDAKVAAVPTYSLPIASATVLGGVKVGSGLSIDANGLLTSTVGGNFLVKTGDAMSGPLRFTATANPSTYNGVDVYLWYSTDGNMRMMLPSARQAFAISNSTGVMSFTYLPTCTAQPSTDTQLANKAYVDSKSYTLPTASASVLGGVKVGAGLAIDATGILSSPVYQLPAATATTLGGVKVGAGLAIDATGILSSPVYQLPTAGASTLGGVKVGAGLAIDATGILSVSGGSGNYLPLSGGTMTGYITLHANPSSALHPVTKQYCDAFIADKVNKAGDTMTGHLTLPATAPQGLQAIHRQFADASYAPKVAFDAMRAEMDALAAQVETLKAEIATLKGAA